MSHDAVRPVGDKTRVLYVGSVPRSGSTLTDLMLGQLPNHVGLGELYYLWHNGPGRDVDCACGRSFSTCPLWTRVGEEAFGGWPDALVAEVKRLQSMVDRTGRIPLILFPWISPTFRRNLVRYAEILEALYRALAAVTGAQVVVDSSKRPSLAFVLRFARGVDLRVAHVVRDPRGVAFSWNKEIHLPSGASHRSQMPRWSPVLVARRWVTVNVMLAALSAVGVRRLVVRYEDLVAEPQTELARIADLDGVALEPTDLSFVADHVLHLASTHVIAGSRIRLSGQTSMRLRVDDEWRGSPARHSLALVSTLTWPLRRRYGYR